MTPASDVLLAALTLTPADAGDADEAYEAVTGPCPWPKAYGGDMVAQAAAAAMRSVDDDRTLHSMHSYFMRPVDIGAPVRYEVDRLRDGRGFSTRQVRGVQNGRTAYLCIASFQVERDGPDFHAAAPLGIPAPEDLPSSARALSGVEPGTPLGGTATEESLAYWAAGRSFDMRHVPGPVYVADADHPLAPGLTSAEGDAGEDDRTVGAGTGGRRQAVWVKAFDTLPDDPDLHRAALAYVCDYTIIEPLLRRIGTPWAQPGLVTASLDHAMWFHRPVRADEWLLYAQEALSLRSARGLTAGRFFDRSGRLVATVAQEALVLPPDG